MEKTGVWEPIGENWTTLKFEGTLPPVLYRYRKVKIDELERLIEFEVVDEAVFLAGIGQLNDPDEGRIRWVLDGSQEIIYEHLKEVITKQNPTMSRVAIKREAQETARTIMTEGRVIRPSIIEQFNSFISNLVRVACFTTHPVNKPMWSHYGNLIDGLRTLEHGGICIEYNCGESWRHMGLCPVSYSSDRPSINMIGSDHERGLQLTKAMFFKDSRWGYEDEWRIAAYMEKNAFYPANLEINSRLQFPNCILSVIFGLNAPDNMIERVRNILNAHGRNVPLKRIVRDSSTQEFVITPI
jgi:hypothetical protein